MLDFSDSLTRASHERHEDKVPHGRVASASADTMGRDKVDPHWSFPQAITDKYIDCHVAMPADQNNTTIWPSGRASYIRLPLVGE